MAGKNNNLADIEGMPDIVPTCRRSPVLSRPALACLADGCAVNLLAGCPFGCRYCYAQGYSSRPQHNGIAFYANAAELLDRQLARMRSRPTRVYFSTACEPFVADDRVLDVLYRSMARLLATSVNVLISTKGVIPTRFVELFSKHTDRVFVQVGLTMTDDGLRQAIEPNAASVDQRFENLSRLRRAGVACEVRADPLIPKLTDTDDNLTQLFERIASLRANEKTHPSQIATKLPCRTVSQHNTLASGAGVVASYLFLRPANRRAITTFRYRSFAFAEHALPLFTSTIHDYSASSTITAVDPTYRRERFARTHELARAAGLTLTLCRCKNPELTTDCCHANATDHFGKASAKPQPQLMMEFEDTSQTVV